MLWLSVFCTALMFLLFILVIKVISLHRAADEIGKELKERLETDTNTLITVSSGDRHIRRLAAGLNTELRKLRGERWRYQSGNLELKEAVTNISHDLRTPLTAICGYLSLLVREEKSEAASRYLEIIGDRTEILKQLTEELFRYFVTASTPVEGDYEMVELNRTLEESISAYYGALKGKGITPEIHIPEEKIRRSLHPGALSRILANIISNAIKYSGGDLEITLNNDGSILFSNLAPDMNEVQVGRLFDRYYTVKDAKKSTGLGLSIAKLLTEQMKGEITAVYDKHRLIIRLWFDS